MEILSRYGKLQVLRDRIQALEHGMIFSGPEEELLDLIDRLLQVLQEEPR